MKSPKCFILPFLLLVLMLDACHKGPTEAKTGTLTGKVLLEGETDHYGITVANY